MNEVKVLDQGFVRLVSYMQPVPHVSENIMGDPLLKPRDEDWTGDLEVVRNARVSYNADWRTGEDEGSDEKLIHFLYNNAHTTPFEAMVFTFEVKLPIFVCREWHRHRTWSYNEISARYKELPEEFYVPRPEDIGRQSATNKQAREIPDDLKSKHFEEAVVPAIENVCEEAFVAYRILLRSGVPRELARTVLPLCTYTRMFAKVDLHNLFHFIRLRADPRAQWEIQQYANSLLELIRPIVPRSVAAYEKREERTAAAFRALELLEDRGHEFE